MNLLQDYRALVTGAGRGIGRAIAERLATAGAAVAVNDIDERAAEDAAQALRDSGLRAFAAPGDVADPDDARRILDAAAAALGGVDGVVNNAGVEHRASIGDHRPQDWRRVMAVNLDAPFFVVQAALPHLGRSAAGAIVNIASVAVMGTFGQAAYDASKGGLLTLTRSLATELGRKGIRVNAVCPGFIETDMVLEDERLAQIGDKQVRTQPLRRMGKPVEVANAVAWLLSDESSYVTGSAIYVDGGWARR
jgi:NAD(P)-dependent dehydrogenase (short-subunit alcohol dehydrogenase family)